MAQLSDQDRFEIWARVMADFSAGHLATPITKAELRQLINFLDVQLESTEAEMFTALPAGDGKDWILANQFAGRDLLARIERRRREVL